MRARGALEVILFAERKFVGSLMFTSSEITIGSEAHAGVRLDDASVAPQHAVVHFTGRTVVLEDPGSPSGTWVGGKRIESHLVQAVDEITIGKYVLRFVVHQAEASAPVESAPVIEAPAQEIPPQLAPIVVAPVAVAPAPVVVAPVVEVAPAPIVEEIAPADEGAVAAAGGEVSAAIDAPDDDDEEDDEQEEEEEEEGDDDDDEDDAVFVPSFSLVDALLERQGDLDLPANKSILQAVFYRDEFIDEIRHLAVGETLEVKGCAASCEAAGQARVRLAPNVTAIVRRRGEARPLDALDGGPGAALNLDPSCLALIKLGAHDRLLLQFVAAVAPLPSAGRRFFLARDTALTALAAVALHLLAITIFGVTSGARAAEAAGLDINQGRFAMLEMKDPVLEQPKVKPKKPEKITKPKPPPPKPVNQPTLPRPTPTPTLPPSLQKYVNQRAQPAAPQTARTTNASANRALDALASLNQPSASSQAVTNLNAVVGHTGAGGFKMNGTIGKLAGDNLRLAPGSNGTGRIDTRSAADFGKNLGRVAGAPAGSGKVRGRVAAQPARNVDVQGELDRGEVLKVINAHLHEVQGCYERRLIHDPSLSGKISLEWVIQPSGNVGVVRVKFSDVKDIEVATCIQGSVRAWHFPQPKGGPVTVTYPFVFSPIGL